jgi:hypothetical protein
VGGATQLTMGRAWTGTPPTDRVSMARESGGSSRPTGHTAGACAGNATGDFWHGAFATESVARFVANGPRLPPLRG